MANMEVIQLFKTYLDTEKGYSENTTISYLDDLYTLIHFLDNEQFGDVLTVSPRIARFYVASLHEHYTPASIARKISSVRSFYNFLISFKLNSLNVSTLEFNTEFLCLFVE